MRSCSLATHHVGPRFRYILGYRILPIPDVEITLEGWVRLVSFLIECLCGKMKASVPLDHVFICQERYSFYVELTIRVGTLTRQMAIGSLGATPATLDYS